MFKKFFNSLSRRGGIRILTYTLSIILVLSVISGASLYKAHFYKNNLELINVRAVDELSNCVKNIDVDLQKCIYSNSDYQLTMICDDLKNNCESAKIMLSFLPAYEKNTENLSKYISQAGNYASAISRKMSKEKKLSVSDVENLSKLKGFSDKIYENLMDLEVRAKDENLYKTSLTKSVFSSKDSNYVSALSTTLSDIEEGFDNYPTLIYDGPFSDHILNKSPQLIKNSKKISVKKAKEKSSRYCRISEDKISFSDEDNGILPCYIFNIENGGKIAVPKRGGYLVYMLRPKTVGEEKIEISNAVALAKEAVSHIFEGDFKESYFEKYDGVLTVNLAYKDNGTICYTDLIKVSVSLDDGNIQMIDARGFVMNHKNNRKIKNPKFSMKKALSNLSSSLKPESSAVALIPSYGGDEVLCYEFKCKGKDDEDILVYVNALTGTEEQIQIVIHTADGSLAM